MNTTALIRPAWTPATIALMVVGFVVWWPLGLAMIAYIIWGDRLEGFKQDANRATDGIFRGCNRASWKAHRWGNSHDRRGGSGFGRTGNVAFDDWREKELARLDEERRKLDAAREEFETYARELRRAKDKEEFDRFINDRDNRQAPVAKSENNGPQDSILD